MSMIPPNLNGMSLGPYRLLEQIGRGGMAVVYKAYEPSLDRFVAVKILPQADERDEAFVARFEREARAIARLNHPNILPVYSFGNSAGVAYIAMQYVQTGTLKDLLGKPLPFDLAAHLFGQIGRALEYAHQHGIIHRDMKPSNVLIGEGHWVLLADFGLAKMLESLTQLTQTGVGMGTPAYMSPEQGQGLKADARSDIYSLGVVLYEMVTGQVPYEAETPMAVVLKHISAPLPLPRVINPALPEAMQNVILKAMAKDPADRFQTAAEMVRAMEIAVAAPPAPPVSEAVVETAPMAIDGAVDPSAPAPTPAAASPATPPAQITSDHEQPIAAHTRHPSRAWTWLVLLMAMIALGAAVVLSWGVPLKDVPGEIAARLQIGIAPTPSPMPTVAARATLAKTRTTRPPSLTMFQLEMFSTSDWATVAIQGDVEVVNSTTIDKQGQFSDIQLEGNEKSMGQGGRAFAGHRVGIVQNITLNRWEAQGDLRIQVQKGCFGVVTVKIYNLNTGAPVLIAGFEGAGCDEQSFNLPLDALYSNRPEAIQPLPEHPVFPTSADQESSVILRACEEQPNQLCIHSAYTGNIVHQIGELPFHLVTAPAWSRDGTQIVFEARNENPDSPLNLYIISHTGENLTPLVRNEGWISSPTWSPDAARIAFLNNQRAIETIQPNGKGRQVLLPRNENLRMINIAWSPDGSRIAIIDEFGWPERSRSLWLVNADGSELRQVHVFPAGYAAAVLAWQPDGQSIGVWNDERLNGIQVHLTGDIIEAHPVIWGPPEWWLQSFWPYFGEQ